MKNKNIKKGLFISLVFIIFTILIITIRLVNSGSKDYIKTDEIELYYRVYTSDGYSDWYKNGEESNNKKSITGIEIKVESEKNGHIIYNTFGDNDSFDDKDSYDGELAGNKKNKLYGIKIDLTDELYKNYDVYYRTYNKKDGWLDYTSSYLISGDNGTNIEKIQIKVLKKDNNFEHSKDKASIGF